MILILIKQGYGGEFSCLCKFTLAYNFSPKWKPYFISEILPEDRCHLNGLALENGYQSTFL